MFQGLIDEAHAWQFVGILLFDAFTGQRPYSTIAQLRVGQFKEALLFEEPIVHVEPAQDKIMMEHYVPLHPQVVGVMRILCDGGGDRARMPMLESFRKWMQGSGFHLRGV